MVLDRNDPADSRLQGTSAPSEEQFKPTAVLLGPAEEASGTTIAAETRLEQPSVREQEAGPRE